MTAAVVDVVLAAALVLVVPLALQLRAAAPLRALPFAVVTAAGAVGAASFAFDQGLLAAVLAVPWLLVPAGILWRGLPAVRDRGIVACLPSLVPPAYLLVGGGWLVLSRYGARPLGFGDAIVELTAVHFHYAGFVAPLLLTQLARWFDERDSPLGAAARLALAGVLVATPLTAAGITFSTGVGAAGATVFAVSLTAAAAMTLVRVVGRLRWGPAVLLSISSASVLAAMVLAVLYAFGQWLGTPAPSLPVMARTHGILNGAGFALAGVVGWLAHDAKRGPEGPLS